MVTFEQGFTYLGVTFMNSLMLTPFNLGPRKRQVLYTRSGRLVGQLTSPRTKNITLRLKQFAKYEDVASP